jgi:hypothetical protein
MILKYLLISFICMSCSSGYPLSSRGESKAWRIDYLKYKSIPDSIKHSYIKGKPCLGMDKKLIEGLFGKPDNLTYFGIWKYPLMDGKTGIIEFNRDGKAISISKELLYNPRIVEN